MLAIKPTLGAGDQGPDIANLHLVLDKLNFGGPITSEERGAKLFGDGTAEAVRSAQTQFSIPQAGVIDETTAGLMNQKLFGMGVFRLAKGSVAKAGGVYVAGITLIAIDYENRGGAELGSINTNADGSYEIFYDPTFYAHPGEGVLKVKDIIDLVIQAYDAKGLMLVMSSALHNPGREVEINLQLPFLPIGQPLEPQGQVQKRETSRIRESVPTSTGIPLLKPIEAPLRLGDSGTKVANLQDGLIFLISQQRIRLPVNPAVSGNPHLAALKLERSAETYKQGTAEVSKVFRAQYKDQFRLTTGEDVDAPTAAAMNRLLEDLGVFQRTQSDDFIVTGRVEFEDGSLGTGLRVAVFDRELGSIRVPLGDIHHPIVTGDDGVFPPVRYTKDDFAKGEGRKGLNADLVFTVTSAHDEVPLKIASLYRRLTIAGEKIERQVPDLVLGFQASQLEDVRIVLVGRPGEQGLAEYTRLMRDLAPLMNGATPADFDQERFRDIDFSARETGWGRALIETMTLAWQLARTATLEPQLLAETFYGLLRQGPPTGVAPLAQTLSELLNQDSRWTSKLEDSLAHHIIDGTLDQHLGRLHELRTGAIMQAGDNRRAGIGDVLAHAGIGGDDRRTLLSAYYAHSGPIEEFWREVVARRLGWSDARIAQVQTALQLADIVSYDLPLITQLGQRGIRVPRDLVKLDRREWVDLVTQVGPSSDAPGATDEDRVTRTVDSITAIVDATYPTETVARLALNSGDTKLTAARDLLARFFRQETATDGGEGFDIRTSPVTKYLETHGERVFRELKPDDKVLLTSQLQRLQRVFRLGVDRVQSETLLALHLDSAFHITRFSPEHFISEFAERLGGAERTSLVYGRAEKIAGTILYMFTDLREEMNEAQPRIFKPASPPEEIPPLKELPRYRELFGSLQLCECAHCQSFYSPAAYFVDLLHMLDRPTLAPNNPVEVLFQRRPDLGHIQLTCENTNTLIPYVDLVTEVLESFVANRAPNAFNMPPAPPNQRLPSPSAEELRVNPVYLTTASETFADQAYAALQETVFPLTLPLNLPLETTRAYLDHLGTSRGQMMTLLDRDPGFEPLMACAAEILLLSPEEFELISGAKFGGASSLRPATTAEIFGLSIAASPVTRFNHAAPEFVRNIAMPDERSALISSLQNVLSFLSTTAIPVAEWGKYGASTEAAVNAYLLKKGLVQNGRTDAAFWGVLEADGMPSLSVLMCPVPSFLDRSGLTYTELITLVKTRFVNPVLQGQGDLDYLARLGIPAADVRAWIQAGLPPPVPGPILAKLKAADEDPTFFTKWVKERARAVVINAGFEAPCDLDRATIMHLDGTLLSPEELVTLFRFVRLWRKLGWSLEDLDHTLEPGGLQSNAVFDTLLLLANIKQLHDQLNMPIADIVSLWQTIPTHGEPSLYDRLFRNRAAQLIDPILELNRERTELKAAEGVTPPTLSDHTGSILAAFRLSAQDLAALRAGIGLEDDPSLPPASRPRLTLDTLSALYRHVSLARAVRLSVRELLSVIDLTGLAVVERPDNFPRGAALTLVEIVEKVRASGVKVSELDYLCREVPQPPGLPGTQREAWRRTLGALLDGLHAIAAEEPIEDDPAGEELTARLTALLGPDDARATTALIYGRDIYTASLAGLAELFKFPAGVAGKIAYDAARKQLKFRGAMTKTDRALLLRAPGVPAALQFAYDGAVKSLDAQPRVFVARALQQLFSSVDAEAALIDVSSLAADGAPVPKVIEEKIKDVLARRQALLSRSLIKQTLTTATGLPADIIELLLENKKVLTALGGAGPAIDDYQGIDGDGLDAEYFPVPDLQGAPTLRRIDETLAFDWQGMVPGPGVPAVGFSVRWTGNLFVPAAGEVTFHVRCTDGVRITVNGASAIDEWRDQPETEFTTTLRLDGGQFYPVNVEYYNKTGAAQLALRWGSPSIPAAVIPQASLYTAGRLELLLQRVERIYKVALLLKPFNLTAHDLQGLAERSDLVLDLMPLSGPAPLPAGRAMFAQWLALYEFATLRDRYQSSELSLIDVPTAPTPAEAIKRFVTITGSAADTIKGIVEGFTIRVFDATAAKWITDAPDLTMLGWWRRIADTLALVQRTGASPKQLLAWAKTREIKQLPTGPETLWFLWTVIDEDGTNRRADNAGLAQQAKNIVRARYDEERWRTVARALNDTLRERRRSALTAYVLAMPEMMRAHVSDSGRLFEYLLIDPEMDSCMETSRIKQGISSVQLFTQRVLLNLESPQVPPGLPDRERWDWMKNYRVWEANRKVFLYAESYVEEELRDDKTAIFKDLESELLQDELNEPNAERVFRHYLEKLDDVAKLIVCGTCIDSDGAALHVFARTATVPFVFYHRRLDNKRGLSWTEGVWSPWQKLPVDIATIDDGDNSGAHLMPIMWNRRLYLFWPLFEQKPDDTQNAMLPEGFDPISCWHIRLEWSEYKDGRWSPKQKGVPFVISKSLVIDKRTTGSYPDSESTHLPPFEVGKRVQPARHIHNEGVLVELGLVNRDVYIPEKTEYFARTLTDADDPMLSGVVLKTAGDFADHEHNVNVINVATFLPSPAAHYLDASVDGKGLSIRVLCRFNEGVAKGQARKIVTDSIRIVQDGKRTDRIDRSTEDDKITDLHPSTFRRVGTFHFPACAAALEGESVMLDFPYESLARPVTTINSFMALRDERGVNWLRLTKSTSPILGAVLTPFDVIDSDNRSGFNHSAPFFYQDQQRCYLVTREMYFKPRQKDRLRPDERASFAEKAVGLATIADRHMGFAADASLRVNSWARTALEQWAKGPGYPIGLRVEAPPGMPTSPGTQTSTGDLVTDRVKDVFDLLSEKVQPEYTFTPHWHPYICAFMTALNSGGLPAMFALENQSRTDLLILFVIGGSGPIVFTNNFESIYKPDPNQVVQPYPLESVDFSLNGSYSKYNWEIFFHNPMTVALAYSRAGRYEDALRWFHFVFDPMTGDSEVSARRVWRFAPFRDMDDVMRIEETLDLLTYAGSDSAKLKQKANLQASIQEWLDNPFNPHIIARRRPVVYMKYVFMKYLDNLIAWADELFRRDTMESINEAIQLYVLAANLLGPKPQRTPVPGSVAPKTYQELRGKLDELSNVQVDLETRLPFIQSSGPGSGTIGSLTKLPQALYFCLPQNDKMLAYWDTIADRLFKIRHCRNLDGTVRQLPLFEPQIDPMLLVEAVAHGLDIGSVLNDLYAPLPRYRFAFMLQQALALCGEVRSLGNSLLTIIEKRDAEKLVTLRAEQERQLLDQVKANKKLQINEAEESRQALENTARMVSGRIEYYENLLAQGLISEESDQLGNLDHSNEWQAMASWIEATAQQLSLIPSVTTGSEQSTTFGGPQLGAAASAVGRSYSSQAASYSYMASRASITGGHARREEEWRFQRDQAKRELSQVERQKAAARIRKEITQAELRNHETQIEQARGVEELLRTKFTNDGLYSYMEGKLRTVYFQCFEAAYESAKRAERSWRYERGVEPSFIKYGAWDSSVRGLLAGERLFLQLKQMELAYLEPQVREFEITKHVSMVQIDPLALIALKETGVCEMELPEWLFDLDYAGHYFRRLKSVSITIPAVVGPYTSLSATLTLLKSKVRESSRVVGSYGDDENYRPDHLAVEAIAASTGQNDSGLFQLDFRDEKYLPFEGAGAISKWRIELPRKFRSFDYDTISDVVLHLKYTARRDEVLAGTALAALQGELDTTAGGTGTLFRFFSLRHEFPSEWQMLRGASTRTATFTILKDRFPLLVQGGLLTITEVHSALILKETRPAVTYKATLTPGAGTPINLEWPGQPGRYRSAAKAAAVTIPITAVPADSGWKLQITQPTLPADLDRIQDILIVPRYSVVM